MNRDLIQFFIDKAGMKSFFNAFALLLLCSISSAWALPGDMLWSSDVGGNIGSSPAIDNASGRIYLGSADRNVYAYDSSGNRLWGFLTSGHIGSAPTVSEDGSIIYVGSHDGSVYALDATTGSELWRFVTAGAVFSSPALGKDGVVYVGSEDGNLYAINPVNGMELWHFPTGGEIGSSPAISYDDELYIGTSNGKLLALDITPDVVDRLKWSFTSSGAQGIYSPAIGADGIIYVGAFDNTFYALNPMGSDATRVKWSITLAGRVASAPAIGNDGLVYVASFDDGQLHAIQTNNGQTKWSFPTGSQIYSSPAIAADGSVIFGAINSKVYSLNPALYGSVNFVPDSLIKWVYLADTPLVSSPVIANNGSVVISSVQTLFAIEDNSGGLSDSAWPMFGLDSRHTGRTLYSFIPLSVNEDIADINTDINTSVNVDVLSNDSGTNISLSSVSTANNGVAEISLDGLFVSYAPNTNFTGSDSFTYTVTNGTYSATSTVNIKVSSTLDTDADGILDTWEVANFGSITIDGTLDSDGDGVSDYQEFLNGTDPHLVPPAAPSDVIAFAGNNQVTFNWSDSAGANEYKVYWSNTPGVTTATVTAIENINGSPFVQNGLTNETTYYYVITSMGPGGESAPSVEVSAVPNSFNWGVPGLVEMLPGDAKNVQLASDANGNSIVLWIQSDGTRDNVWANVYTAGSGWGDSQIIEFDDTANMSTPLVSMNSAGDATVIWKQNDGVSESLWSNSYTWNSSSWGTPSKIVTASTNTILEASVVHQNDGTIIATWAQDLDSLTGTTADSVFASQLDLNNTWITPVQIGSGSGTITHVLESQLIDLANDGVMAIWLQSQDGGVTYEIAYNSYTVATGWATAQILQSGLRSAAVNIEAAVNAQGQLILVWSDGSIPAVIWSASYSAGIWELPVQFITDASGTINNITIDNNSSGDAVLSWVQSDGTRNVVNVITYSTATGWGTSPIQISSDVLAASNGDSAVPDVVMDAAGNIIVTWQQSDGVIDNIWANRFDAATNTWEGAQVIETTNDGNATSPQVIIGFDGTAIVTWQQSDGTENSIWFNQLISGTTSVPNIAPVIHINSLNIVVDEQSLITLDASASYDQDGSLFSTSWTQISGDIVTLTGADSLSPSFTAPFVYQDTVYSFKLDVTDNQGVMTSATVNVNVASTNPDDDGDGLADLWEIQYFGNLAYDATGDFDNDGISNLQEFAQGTMPDAVTVNSPINVIAIPQNGQVELRWDPVPGAIGYNVYWSNTSGVERETGTQLTNVSSPFTHTDLTNGNTYYYVVTALSYGDESVSSVQTSVQPDVRYWSEVNIMMPSLPAGSINAQVEIDDDGNMVAVWEQIEGAVYSLWSSNFTKINGWDAAVAIEKTNTNVLEPVLAMNSEGSAVVAWMQSDGVEYHIWASIYSLDAGWNIPQKITFSGSALDKFEPALAIDDDGNILIVWEQLENGNNYLRATYYDVNAASWSAPMDVFNAFTKENDDIEIKMSSNGNAFVVWSLEGDDTDQVMVSQFSHDTQVWSNEVQLNTNNYLEPEDPQLVIDTNGNAVVVWEQSIGNQVNLWSSKYDQINGWGLPVQVEFSLQDNDESLDHVMEIDGEDNVILIWKRHDGTALSVWSSRYTGAAGVWSEAIKIEHAQDYHADQLNLDVDEFGNAIAVWSAISIYNDAITTRSNRYSVQYNSWGTEKVLNSGYAVNPAVSINRYGNSIVTWSQIEGGSNYNYEEHEEHEVDDIIEYIDPNLMRLYSSENYLFSD